MGRARRGQVGGARHGDVNGDLVFDALPALGGLFARAAVTGLRRRGGPLPERAARASGVTTDVGRVAAYDRVCGFGLRDVVPATWLHVLAFPLQAALMAERDFPFALAGLVHASNEMTLRRGVRVGESLDLTVRPGGVRAHRKGTLFELISECRVEDELVWSGVSTYLALGAASDPAPSTGSGGVTTGAGDGPVAELVEAPSQTWRLASDLGRRYAAVSGDVNPIHLYPATARLFGFARPIIHGMWTHARALAALQGRLGESYTVGVRFSRPILLPGTVRFAASETDAGVTFAVLGREDKPHLTGHVG